MKILLEMKIMRLKKIKQFKDLKLLIKIYGKY